MGDPLIAEIMAIARRFGVICAVLPLVSLCEIAAATTYWLLGLKQSWL